MTKLIAEYNVFAAPIANVVVGNADGPITRAATAGESQLGHLIADAQLASAANAGGQFALKTPAASARISTAGRSRTGSVRRAAVQQHRDDEDPDRCPD